MFLLCEQRVNFLHRDHYLTKQHCYVGETSCSGMSNRVLLSYGKSEGEKTDTCSDLIMKAPFHLKLCCYVAGIVDY